MNYPSIQIDELKKENEILKAELTRITKEYEELKRNQQGPTTECEKLIDNKELYCQIVRTAYEGIWLCNTNAVTTFVNKRMAEMLGYSEEEMIGKSAYDFIDKEFLHVANDSQNRRLAGKRDFYEQKYVRKDGTPLWAYVAASQLYNNDGTVSALLGLLTDITKQKEAEEELGESQQRFAAAFRSNPNALSLSKLEDGTILDINDSFTKILGWTRDECIGKSSLTLNIFNNLTDREKFKTFLSEGGQIHNYEFIIKNRDGKTIPVLISAEMLKLKQGNLILTTIQDITELKNINASLRDTEQRYTSLFNNKTNGIAHCRILCDDLGEAVDFVILQVNDAYLNISGIKKEDIEGKTARMVLPGIEEYIKRYAKVALQGEEQSFETFYRPLNIWFLVYAFSYTKGEFTVIFSDITDRKRIEAELRLSEAAMEAFFDSSPGILNLFDNELRFIKTDRLTPGFFGLDQQSIKGKSILDLNPKLAVKHLIPIKESILANGNPVLNTQINNLNPLNTEEEFFSMSFFPVPLPNGEIGIGAIGSDITSQKRAEKTLALEQELFQSIFDNIPVMITIYDPNLKNFRFNAALKRILGWEEEDALEGDFVSKVYPNPVLYQEVVNFMVSLESGWKEFTATAKDGSKLETSWANILLSDGVLIGIGIDISERKAARQKLLENEERFRTLADNISPFAWMADENGWIFWYNKQWFDYTGTKLDEVKGWGWKKVFHPDHRERVVSSFKKALETGENWEDTFPIRAKDGSYGWFLSRALPIRDENGRIIRWFGSNTDITQLRAAKEDLIVAKEKAEENDRLKSAFMANMSHEIRTPMTGILGFTDLLKMPDLSEEKKKAYLDIIETSGHRMLQIINDLIDISKIEAGQIEINYSDTDISKLLNELLLFFIPDSNKKEIFLKLNNKVTDDKSFTRTDKTKLTQILSNLIKNALKFTHQGTIEFGCELKNNFYHFYVKDTGIGINEQFHDKIFERFRQGEVNSSEKTEGVGLGLAISKAYVELLGGAIHVESAPGQGSKFHFTIPYLQATVIQPSAPEEHKVEQSLPNLKILIAEDEEGIYYLLREILRRNNIETVYASNGQDAIDKMKEHSDIKLILMDTKMPKMNGLEATRIIKSTNPSIPIIALSAFSSELDRNNALEAGCDDYLVKPMDRKSLLEKIALYI